MIRKASQTCCNGNPWQWVHNRNACVLRVRVHACTDKKANMCILCLHSIYIHICIYIYVCIYLHESTSKQTVNACGSCLAGKRCVGGGCMYVGVHAGRSESTKRIEHGLRTTTQIIQVLSDRSAANQKQIEKTQKRDYRSGLPLRPLPRSFRDSAGAWAQAQRQRQAPPRRRGGLGGLRVEDGGPGLDAKVRCFLLGCGQATVSLLLVKPFGSRTLLEVV